MRITDWPIEDRPREKLLLKGEKSLTDAELLAIFINTGLPNKTALDIAKELLQEHGSLKKILHYQNILPFKKHGIGKAKFAMLKAAIELGRRFRQENITVGQRLNNSREVHTFLMGQLSDHTNEVFACLFLDNHLRLLHFAELFYGTVDSAQIYPREIVRRGLQLNAAKIILAHNHPSGSPMPSQADKEVTQLVKQALKLVDIDVVDHIIIGHQQYFSFAEMGLLKGRDDKNP
jgi:DNA repair protein RadC